MKSKKKVLFQSLISLLLCFSMLVGTTFAWFTDSVVTGINTIAAGNLDVELYHSNAAVTDEQVGSATKLFLDLQGKPILWEPGVVSYENLRVTNAGDLALVYQLAISTANENYVVDASGVRYGLSQILKVGVVEGGITATDRASVVASVETANWTTLAQFVREGKLLPEGAGESEKTWGIVIWWEPGDNDNYWNLNNGKELNEGDVLTIDLGVKLIATQTDYESDSFGDDYDATAKTDVFPEFVGGTASVPVTPGADNKTAVAVTMTAGQVSAYVPAGVQLADDVTALTLTVTQMNATGSNVILGENEAMRSLDVHIEGVAQNNSVPITVTLKEVAPVGLNMGNYKLYHVENGATEEMTLVDSGADFTVHNQFKYDPATGDIVLYMATFSEVAVVADTENAWNGEYDYKWYDADATELTIANADQLAGFGAIVGGMDGQTADTFKDKTVKLISDINLGDKDNADANHIFYPIGYYNSTGSYKKVSGGSVTSDVNSFEGTFDGNGHTIKNFYQNTWEMFGDYNSGYSGTPNHYKDAMGLFGYVLNGTVKNLTVDHFSSDGEFTPTGVIAAYAVKSTFENIAITNCNPRVYNTGNGGIVGIGGDSSDTAASKLIFKNITIDNTNKISALWGSWDVACGGLMGMFFGPDDVANASRIEMTNCHVAAQIDVNNDVCGNYQYYWYRYSGMMVGTIDYHKTENGYTVPDTSMIRASGCTVHFGDWNDYYYCELVANSLASYTHDHQFSRLEQISSLDEIKSGETWTKTGNFLLIDGDTKTCYHIVKNSDGTLTRHLHEDAGTETVNGETVLKEDKQIVYLPFNQLFTGYGWGVKNIPVYNGEDYAFEGITILDRETADSVQKFTENDSVPEIKNGSIVYVGDLFKAAQIADSKLNIKSENVQVFVSPLNSDSTVRVEYEPNDDDWTKGKLTFSGSGSAEVVITDYNYCIPTKLTISIGTADKFAIKLPNTAECLYRVGSLSPVSIGSLFMQRTDYTGTIDSTKVAVSVTNVISSQKMDNVVTLNTDTWTNGTLDFADDFTGVVKVTIYGDDATAVDLYLEVVDAKNITTATGSNRTDVVLLNDVQIPSGGTANYTNCTVYGNGFTFDVRGGMNQYNSKQGHGIIIINIATLDNLRIEGDVYDEYGMYTTTLTGGAQNDYTAAVDATNSTIQNCYIANCAAPIRSNGNTIIDTTLYGGTVANLLISGGTNTLTNVTTINYNDGRGVIGMGIVITDGASEDTTKLILNGYLKQYNYVFETDISKITVGEAKTVFNSIFDNQFSGYHIGSNPKAVNTGIISINEAIDLDSSVFTDNANTGYLISNDVSVTFSAQGMSKKIGAAIASVPASGSVDNNYQNNGNVQGNYLPTFTFDLGDQMLTKDNDDDTRYLIGDANGLTAMYPKGEAALTLDLTELATVTKYTDVSYPVEAKCVGPDGKEQTGTVTLDTKGTYKLVFTVNDNVFYDQNGNTIEQSVIRTYEVILQLDVYEKSIADATITINSTDLTGEWGGYSGSWKYTMYPLDAISAIEDDANKDGTAEAFNYKSNITSVVLTPASNNAFSAATTVTITYSGGQVLELVLGVPSGCSSPGASNGGKTLSASTDNTHGIKIVSDGKIANKCNGTWPITSWSFKGTSTKTVSDTTKVNIVFSADSSTSGSCLAAGSMITLADGSKKAVEELRKGDIVMAFDHITGEIVNKDVVIVGKTYADCYYKNVFIFDDGTELATINEHGIYDLDIRAYVNIDHNNYHQYLGHRFASVDSHGNIGVKRLVDVITTCESGYKYDIVTNETLNYVVEDTLSVSHEIVTIMNSFAFADNMLYDAEAMKADIEKYGLYTYEDFATYCEREVFEQYNMAMMKVGVGKGLYTKAHLVYLLTEIALNNDVQITD